MMVKTKMVKITMIMDLQPKSGLELSETLWLWLKAKPKPAN